MLETHNINTKIYYIKYCLLAFTVLFSLTGLSLVIIGSTINAVFTEFSFFLENKYFAPAVFLYSVGFVVFGVSIIGLVGALKENTCIITTYGILLGVIFVLQVATGISTSSILMSSTIYNQLHDKLNSVLVYYDSNSEYRNHLDALQRGVGCCGINGPNDWNKLILPISCCAKFEGDNTCKVTYRRGCFEVLESIINDVGGILASSAYVLALMQLAGACFALYLGSSLRQQKLAKECRRWILSNELLNSIEKEDFPMAKN